MSNPTDRPEPKWGGIDIHDHLEIRCPRLGGQVTFGYCRREGGQRPCQRSLVCWRSLFSVEDYFKRVLSTDAWVQCFLAAPKPRVISLLECIEEAKQRVVESSDLPHR